MIVAQRGADRVLLGQTAAGRRDLTRGITALQQQGLTPIAAFYRLWTALLDAEAGLFDDARLALRRSARELGERGWGYAELAEKGEARLRGRSVALPACGEWTLRPWWTRLDAVASARR
jgi:hypothetical protein